MVRQGRLNWSQSPIHPPGARTPPAAGWPSLAHSSNCQRTLTVGQVSQPARASTFTSINLRIQHRIIFRAVSVTHQQPRMRRITRTTAGTRTIQIPAFFPMIPRFSCPLITAALPPILSRAARPSSVLILINLWIKPSSFQPFLHTFHRSHVFAKSRTGRVSRQTPCPSVDCIAPPPPLLFPRFVNDSRFLRSRNGYKRNDRKEEGEH